MEGDTLLNTGLFTRAFPAEVMGMKMILSFGQVVTQKELLLL